MSAAVQDLPRRDRLAPALGRVGDTEDVGQETRDLLRGSRLLLCLVLGAARADHPDGGSREAAEQGERHRRGGRADQGMAPDETIEPVGERRRPDAHGLAAEMAPEVLGELGHRRVPVVSFHGQSLRHDPVEVAAE